MSIINAIISAIMSFIMLFFPGIGGGDDKTIILADQIKVVDDYDGRTGVIDDYSTWKKTAIGAKDSKYTQDFFEDNSVALVKVTRPSPGYEVVVRRAYEQGSKLVVEYKLEELPGFFVEIVCDSTIVVPVSKNVKICSAEKV